MLVICPQRADPRLDLGLLEERLESLDADVGCRVKNSAVTQRGRKAPYFGGADRKSVV